MARSKKVKIEELPSERLTTVIITKKYYDIQLSCEVQRGTTFKCSQERAKQLINAKVAELISIKK